MEIVIVVFSLLVLGFGIVAIRRASHPEEFSGHAGEPEAEAMDRPGDASSEAENPEEPGDPSPGDQDRS